MPRASTLRHVIHDAPSPKPALLARVMSFAQPLVLKGPGVPLVVSLLAHAGIAVVAARHVPLVTNVRSALAEVEVSAPEILQNDSALLPERAVLPASTSRAANIAARPQVRTALREPSLAAPESVSRRPAAPDPSPVSDGPRFVIAARQNPVGSGSTSMKGVAGSPSAAEAPIAESAADTPARLKLGGTPAYTASALSAGIEADVPLEIVVSEAGAVVQARVLAHIGYGLDQAALESVRGYRFSAASRQGKAVAVRMRWLMRFQLR
jgi:TonB family protein